MDARQKDNVDSEERKGERKTKRLRGRDREWKTLIYTYLV